MNPETKEFSKVTKDDIESGLYKDGGARGSWKLFNIGQEIEINGVTFRVRKITNKDVILRPLMKQPIIEGEPA